MPYAVAALHNDAMNDMRFRQIARAASARFQLSQPESDASCFTTPGRPARGRSSSDCTASADHCADDAGAAKAFVPQYLNTPDDVFDISTDEFIALFHEPDPRFITLSLERRRKLLEAEQELRKCWSVSKQDFQEVTQDADRLWDWLGSERVGLIDQNGARQDKCRSLTDSSQMPLDNIFESDREAIFTTLRRPLTRLALGITVFESRVKEAVQVLEQQYKAATLERTEMPTEQNRTG